MGGVIAEEDKYRTCKDMNDVVGLHFIPFGINAAGTLGPQAREFLENYLPKAAENSEYSTAWATHHYWQLLSMARVVGNARIYEACRPAVRVAQLHSQHQ